MPPRKGSPAELLLKKVEAAYRNVNRYEDEGFIKRVISDEKSETVLKKSSFKNLFSRPNRFYSEERWIGEDGTEVVIAMWFDGKGFFHFWDTGEKHFFELAGPGRGGISNQTYIMLTNPTDNMSLTNQIRNPKIIPSSRNRTGLCTTIWSEFNESETWIFDIDPHDHFIRRIQKTKSWDPEAIESHNSWVQSLGNLLDQLFFQRSGMRQARTKFLGRVKSLAKDTKVIGKETEVRTYESILTNHQIPDDKFVYEPALQMEPLSMREGLSDEMLNRIREAFDNN
ncbi:MAG: hypothetical protein H6751_06900 [Candidatus Omnitrophica bacterium]|nr:hypothetical protein [Candidatus Omnitrophota bacterium]MCA9426096.1 hypothetical protein [Candidatus Omnitrophota bacterium]MCA9437332.1 hypothetical protein [Candidatus Omnitrophota bacterium]MCA9441960.1 hypothetical protein [Candidatus Omnitrophota bacterium]MCB9782675.1 hypothetical protein [Candidatus Omnitrophota bacterium]